MEDTWTHKMSSRYKLQNYFDLRLNAVMVVLATAPTMAMMAALLYNEHVEEAI